MDKLCPLNGFKTCVKGQCAWWFEKDYLEEGMCSILLLS